MRDNTPTPGEPISDEELLAKLRAGEQQHFPELLRRYEREIYGYLRRYVGSEDLAADIFQNTFVAVFRKIQHYEPGRPARPWLYTIATRQAIDALRHRNRRLDRLTEVIAHRPEEDANQELTFEDWLYDRSEGPVAQVEAAELRQRVRDAIDQLPELLKQMILMAYFQGLRYQEIADALDIPLGTVKSRLHAAVARLSEVWQTQSSPDDAIP